MELQGYQIPDGLLYTREHEWARDDGPVVRVGITDYAAKTLNDIVYVTTPKTNEKVVQFKAMGSIESIKAVSELYAPVTGEVMAANTKLQEKPELLNSDPHGESWLIQVRLVDRRETEKLMTAEEYEAYLREEKAH